MAKHKQNKVVLGHHVTKDGKEKLGKLEVYNTTDWRADAEMKDWRQPCPENCDCCAIDNENLPEMKGQTSVVGTILFNITLLVIVGAMVGAGAAYFQKSWFVGELWGASGVILTTLFSFLAATAIYLCLKGKVFFWWLVTVTGLVKAGLLLFKLQFG